MKPRNPIIECRDGFTVSVQGSETAYALPRENYPANGYTHVECGYPSADPETVAFREYAELYDTEDYTNTVYPYMPIEIVESELESHGGITKGKLPS